MFQRISAVALTAMLLMSGFRAQAQGSLSKESLNELRTVEDSLLVTADSMYTAHLPEQRLALTEQFARQLVRALRVNSSWSYEFSRLGQKINIIYPEDRSFRIFNWVVAPSDRTRRYYGAIQLPAEKLKLYGLVDHSDELGQGASDSVLTGGRWMGGLYYRIIDKEVNGKKLYTLFAQNGSSLASNRKFLDVLQLTDQGPVFGAQLFSIRSQNFPAQRVNRFILEYKKDVQASMNWDGELNAIYFDRLISDINDPGRKYTYVPSGQYDGFRWENGEWKYYQDLIQPLQLKDGEAPVGQPQ